MSDLNAIAELKQVIALGNVQEQNAARVALFRATLDFTLLDELIASARSGVVPDCYEAESAIHDAVARDKAFVPGVVCLFESWFDDIIERAVSLLASERVDVVVPLLLSSLDKANEKRQIGALMTIRQLGTSVTPWREDIEQAFFTNGTFTSNSLDVRRLCADACAELTIGTLAVENSLVALLRDDELWVVERAAVAILKIGFDDQAIMRMAAKRLQDMADSVSDEDLALARRILQP